MCVSLPHSSLAIDHFPKEVPPIAITSRAGVQSGGLRVHVGVDGDLVGQLLQDLEVTPSVEHVGWQSHPGFVFRVAEKSFSLFLSIPFHQENLDTARVLFKNGKIFSQGKDEYGPNGVDNKNLPTTVGRPPTDISFTPENNVLSFEQVLISLFCVIFPNEILEVFQEKRKKENIFVQLN